MASHPRPPPDAQEAEELVEGERAPAKRMRRFPHVWQLDEMDCGAACLAMICRHYGREVSLAAHPQARPHELDGTSLAGIVRGAAELGLEVRALKASKARLERAAAAGDRALGGQPLGRAATT